MAPTNKAAFYPSDKASSLHVAPSPYPTAGPSDVIVRVAAAAVNPVDWKIQEVGTAVFPFLQYPLAGGLDVAGTVVEVGSATSPRGPGRFQNYVAVPASLATPLPATTPFADAAVLPSGVATAAVALYQYLGLAHPSLPARTGTRQTVLITAGASSVGSNAIQLAAASGYEVFTTASPRHFAHCAALGASRVFDYHSPTLLAELQAAFRGKRCAGGLSAVESSNDLAFAVVGASEGEDRKSVACTILFSQDGVPANIRADMIHAFHIKDTPLADVVFGTYLPAALETGRYKCEPKPRVVGTSLEAVQTALDIGKANGVSCEKLVITLAGEA
ncbi:hypothetical protein GQX73_g9791 [Xylaria multiplex]|uniref:Enoyl reductase (ER) domain-containing protein n=1 Tax=Xylaria multiplex TaxID=323545 RepID=A0A7C8MM00_9PEZI|nr:hypothetical protein GQX73_g9791 [Xylaria multiplex]